MGMNIDISGLDALQRELKDIEKAMASLNGTIAELSFDPADADSIKSAITKMEHAVDTKIASYKRNPLVSDIAKEAKKHYREQVLELARKASQSNS